MKKTKKLVMSWLLAFCCVITLVAPSVVNAAADDFEIIDDTDARFVYSDGNANNGGWESAGAGDASVTEHWATRQARHWTLHSTEQNWSFTVKKLQIMQCSA